MTAAEQRAIPGLFTLDAIFQGFPPHGVGPRAVLGVVQTHGADGWLIGHH